MTTDEREIFHFLKNWGAEFTTAAEVARRAGGKKRYHDDPNWAKPILMNMAERGILDSDMNGRYRVKPVPRKNKGNKWISPDIAKILKESGVEPEEAVNTGDVAPDDYYEQL